MGIQSYRDLDVWQVSMNLVETCYLITRSFPKDEIYGLTSQIRRAAVSVPANIAEGYGREQTGAFIQFLRVAQGSARELETHLLIARRLQMVSEEESSPLQADCDRISKMLRALIRSLENRRSASD